MPLPTRGRLLAALVWLLAVLPSLAWAGDGDLQWHTLRTARYHIHYPHTHKSFALRTAAVLDDAFAHLQPLFGYRPSQPLQVTIDDYADNANGFASLLPYDRIHLQAWPPDVTEELADHGDWLRMLVFHELTHILHLGEVGGLPAAVNAVLGRTLLPGGTLPRFVTEGIATHVETRHTGGDVAVAGKGGRVHSAQFGALLRAAVRDGTLPERPAQFAGRPLVWPRGTMWYLYGSLLMDALVQRFGHGALRDFVHRYSVSLVGYGIQNTARQAFGASLDRLWRDARQQASATIRQQWQQTHGLAPDAAEPLGDGQRLTRDGEWRGRLRRVDNQSLLVAHGPRDALPRLQHWRTDGQLLAQHTCALDCDEPIALPGGGWLFVTSRPMRRVYQFRELAVVDRPGGTERLLTKGMRVRSVALSNDGQWLTAIRVRQGTTQVVALPLRPLLERARTGQVPEQAGAVPDGPATDDPLLKVLVPALPLGQTWDAPLLHDGQLYVTRQDGAGRKLYAGPCAPSAADRACGPMAPLSGQFVQGGDPLLPLPLQGSPQPVGWVGDVQATADGRLSALVDLGSPPLGRRDAAVWDPRQPQRGWQLLTRTLTGLGSASVVGADVVTVRHGGRGLDLWLRRGAAAPTSVTGGVGLPDAATAAAGGPGPAALTPPYAPPAVAVTAGGYWPWSLRPRAWRPTWLATTDAAPTLGVTLSGKDAVEWAELSLLGQARLDGTNPVLQADLTVRRWEPTLAASLAYDHSAAWFVRGIRGYLADTERLGLRLGADWRYPLLRSAVGLSGAVRGVHTGLRWPWQLRSVPDDPAGLPPRNPFTGWSGLLDLGVWWEYSQGWPDQTRAERLHSANAQWTRGVREDGGEATEVWFAATRHHLPLGHRRFVELTGQVAAATQTAGGGGGYRATGVSALQPLAVLGLAGPQGWVVRGLPMDGVRQDGTTLGGDGLAWGSAALHWPLGNVARTLDLLPVYAGRPYLSVFADWAHGFWPVPGLAPGWAGSLGLELSVDVELGYLPMGLLRLGYARTLDGGGAGWLSLGP